LFGSIPIGVKRGVRWGRVKQRERGGSKLEPLSHFSYPILPAGHRHGTCLAEASFMPLLDAHAASTLQARFGNILLRELLKTPQSTPFP